MKKRLKNIQTFEQHSSEFNISDISDIKKYWFNDREKWEMERNKLDVSNDDVNWSKDNSGKLISFWHEDRNEGCVKK
jgi:hypothetical protein